MSKIHGNKQEQRHYLPDLWNTAKAVLRGKFIAVQAFIRKEERSHKNNLAEQIKKQENDQEKEPKARRREEIRKLKSGN